MSLLKLLNKLVPNFWDSIASRKEVISEYRRIREHIRTKSSFQMRFPDPNSLSGWIEKSHFELVSEIEESSYKNNEGKLEMATSNADRVKSRITRQIWLIRCRNIITAIFWGGLIIGIIAAGYGVGETLLQIAQNI